MGVEVPLHRNQVRLDVAPLLLLVCERPAHQEVCHGVARGTAVEVEGALRARGTVDPLADPEDLRAELQAVIADLRGEIISEGQHRIAVVVRHVGRAYVAPALAEDDVRNLVAGILGEQLGNVQSVGPLLHVQKRPVDSVPGEPESELVDHRRGHDVRQAGH